MLLSFYKSNTDLYRDRQPRSCLSINLSVGTQGRHPTWQSLLTVTAAGSLKATGTSPALMTQTRIRSQYIFIQDDKLVCSAYQLPVYMFVCVRDNEDDDPAQSLMWTFPPTVKPITMNKLQIGHKPAESKVDVYINLFHFCCFSFICCCVVSEYKCQNKQYLS